MVRPLCVSHARLRNVQWPSRSVWKTTSPTLSTTERCIASLARRRSSARVRSVTSAASSMPPVTAPVSSRSGTVWVL